MDVRILVGICDLVIIDLGKPVVGRDGTRIMENKSADRVSNGGVLFNTPVLFLNVAVHKLLVVKDGGLHVPDLFSVLAVKDVCLCHFVVACLVEDFLNTVLDRFHADGSVLNLTLEHGCNPQCKKVDDVVVVEFFCGVECFFDCA